MCPLTPQTCVITSFILSILICYRLIPSVIHLAKKKKLYDEPNYRSSHSHVIPSLGGIAIFMAFSLTFLIFSSDLLAHELRYIMAATLIVFAIGVKDDIINIPPKKKLMAQIVAAFIVTTLGGIRITNLHGLIGFNEIHDVFSIILSIFAIIVIINGFNLIDGIDGLASGISGICTLTFGIWFYMTGHYQYAILSASLLGALVAFFQCNVFGKRNKIFMGDTGSLLIGLLISILMIKFNEMNINPDFKYAVKSAPAISIAILAVPIFDILRVIFIRIKKGKSPFDPDKNHVHHRMVSLGFKHIHASFRIMAVNILFIAIAIVLRNTGYIILVSSIIALGLFFSWLPSGLLRKKRIKAINEYKAN